MSSLFLCLLRITLTRQSGYRQEGLFASHVQKLEHNGLSVDRVDEESEADLSDPTSTSNDVASRRQILLDTGLKERHDEMRWCPCHNALQVRDISDRFNQMLMAETDELRLQLDIIQASVQARV